MRLFKIAVLLALSAAGYLWWAESSAPIGVNLHGVNYTGEAFSFYLTDPERPELISGGSGLIEPFGGSGINCCAMLPRTWHPGLKLTIHTRRYLKKQPDGSLPEIQDIAHVDVPKYVDEKPGEIWVLRTAIDKVEVVSSDVEPDHALWPGRVKGWPEPSTEYRRERWEIYRKLAVSDVDLYESFLAKLKTNPEISAQESWDYAQKYDAKALQGFSGPRDARYRAELKSHYIQSLKRNKLELERIMEAKP